MDPLSALAVACNVLELVKQGYNVLSIAAKIYKSSGQAPAEIVTLQSLTEKLQALNQGLESSIPRDVGSPDSPQTRLWQANRDCLRISNDFINLLESFNVKGSNSLFQSLRKAFKIKLSGGEIDNAQKGLAQAKGNLTISMLIYMQ